MSDDAPTPRGGGRKGHPPRVPVKLHRNVSLVKTGDAHLAEEVLAIKKFGRLIAGRLTDTVLLVQPGQEEAVIEELRKIGHTPQVIRGGSR